jgi:hypothetical protein
MRAGQYPQKALNYTNQFKEKCFNPTKSGEMLFITKIACEKTPMAKRIKTDGKSNNRFPYSVNKSHISFSQTEMADFQQKWFLHFLMHKEKSKEHEEISIFRFFLH